MSESVITKKFIKNLLSYWEEDTIHQSVIQLSHPAIDIIKKIAKCENKEIFVTSAIVEHLQEKESLAFAILSSYLPDEKLPQLTKEDTGSLCNLREKWLNWGYNNGYIVRDFSKHIFIYSDGACEGNPGKGGYGAIIRMPHGPEIRLTGGFRKTTNNRMELISVLKPLERLHPLRENYQIIITTDSQYVSNAFNKGWLYGWVKNNWKKSDGDPVANKDILEKLYSFKKMYNISFKWIKGHSGNEYNEICDQMAVTARKLDEKSLMIDEEYENSCKTQ